MSADSRPLFASAPRRAVTHENVPSAEPPQQIVYDLEEALTLLGALEDGRDALIDSGHLTVVMAIEIEIRLLSHRLGFDDPAGGFDGG